MSEIDKGKSRVTNTAKKGTVGVTKAGVKGAATAGKVAVSGILKGGKKLALNLGIGSIGAAIVVIILIAAMLTTAIMGTAVSMTSDTEMKKQSPELTKAFLNTNEDAFKAKVMELVQDERFRSYVMNGEFDNAYTKLVYGGTSAYTGKEIQSYAKADAEDRTWLKFTKDGKKVNKLYKKIEELQLVLQEEGVKACKKEIKSALKQDSSIFSEGFGFFERNDYEKNLKDALKTKNSDKIGRYLEKNKNKIIRKIDDLTKEGDLDFSTDKYENGYANIHSLLEKIEKEYLEKGVKPENIKISDQYLKGYGKASGYYRADQDIKIDKIEKRITSYNNIKNSVLSLYQSKADATAKKIAGNQFDINKSKADITNIRITKNNIKFNSKNKVVLYKNGSTNGLPLDKGFVRVKIKEGDFIVLQDDTTKLYKSFKVKKNLKTKNTSIDEEIKSLETEKRNLKGQGRTNEVMEEELPFDKWINYSYYTIPYYYHVNMARNSEYQNHLGGTLSKSERFYANLTTMFGADMIDNIGSLILGVGALSTAGNKITHAQFKKKTDKFLKAMKNDTNQEKAAKKICEEEFALEKATSIAVNADEKLKSTQSTAALAAGTLAKGAGIYAKLNSYKALLKTLSSDEELQLGLPNWNVDSGNWQFMTFETKDVYKYPSLVDKRAKRLGSRYDSWYDYTLMEFPSLSKVKFKKWGKSYKKKYENYKKHNTIWNNQLWLSIVENGHGLIRDAIEGLAGKNALYDSTQEYENEYKIYNNESFRSMSYKDILNTGFTSLKTSNPLHSTMTGSKYDSEGNKKDFYPAQGVMIGYKQYPVQDAWTSTWNGMLGYDEFYNYYAFSKYATRSYHRNDPFSANDYEKGEGYKSDFKEMVDNLYIHDWEDKKAQGYSNAKNYEIYLANVNDIENVSKREKSNKKSVDNSEISKLIDQFASYFINQIYFTYSDNIDDNGGEATETGGGSDYITDYFLSSAVSKEKKIAFLQRSFYAMATGTAFTYDSEEAYDLKNNKLSSCLNGSTVGELELNSTVKLGSIKYYQTPLSRITNMTEFRGDVQYVSNLSVGKSAIELNEERIHEKPTVKETAIALNEMLRAMAEDKILYMGEVGRKELQSIYKRYKNDVMGWYESPNLNDAAPFTIEYNATIVCKNKGKTTNKKGTVTVEYCKVNGLNAFKPKYTVRINEEKDVDDLIYKHTKWNKEFYENHECDIKEKAYSFEGDYFAEYNGAETSDLVTSEELSNKGLGKKLNAFLDGSFPISGKLTGERDIVIDYQTAGFLTYDIQEEKDDAGNISEVHANVYIKFPEEEMITRLAYAWEREGMLNEALKLYKIYTDQGNLQGAESRVDLNELIINYNPNEGDIDDEDIENANLPSMIKPEMVRAAFRSQEEYKVPVSSTLAQIILESGGKYEGLSKLAFEQKNLFGMKSGKNKWTIGSKAYATKEQSENGTTYGITAEFSVYKSWTDAIMDRADLLTSYSRVGYGQHTKPFLNNNPKKYTPKKAIQFVASYSYPNKPAWATDHEYLSKIRGIMEKHNLFQYDNMTYAEYKATVTGGANGTGIEGVIAEAYEQHGKMYSQEHGGKYNRTGPNAYDCSGLVYHCFSKVAGIDFGQDTGSQLSGLARLAKQGDKTSGNFYVMEIKDPKDLRRGDLIYTRYGSGRHVAFYINKNTQYDASDHYPGTKSKKNGKDFWPKDIGEHTLSLKNVIKMYRVVIITEGDELNNMANSYLPTPLGQKVVSTCPTVKSPGANLCAMWARMVYQKAGITLKTQAGAIQYWTRRKNDYRTWVSHKFKKKFNLDLVSGEDKNIPLGAFVIGHGSGDMGRKYGHIGIYIGNGEVVSNVSKIKKESMKSFNDWQKTCGGLEGWIAPRGMVKIFKCQLKGANLSESEFKKLQTRQFVQTLSKDTKCTGYCTCAICCGKTNGITASGANFKAYYTCAVDRNKIPLGSDIYVKYKGRYFKYKAQDVGGAIKETHVDLGFPNHKSALKWGSPHLPVYFVAKKNRSSKEMKKISKAKNKKNLPLNQTFNFN